MFRKMKVDKAKQDIESAVQSIKETEYDRRRKNPGFPEILEVTWEPTGFMQYSFDFVGREKAPISSNGETEVACYKLIEIKKFRKVVVEISASTGIGMISQNKA